MSFNERVTLFADVILPLAIEKSYTYRVPLELNELLIPGHRVVVQFGRRRLYTGIVKQVHSTPPKGYEAKYILSLLDDKPLVNDTQLQFWQWMASYYACNTGEVMNAALPAALKLQSETVLLLSPDADPEGSVLDKREIPVIGLLQGQGEIGISELMNLTELKNPFPIIKSLYEKGLVITREEISESYRPRKLAFISLADTFRHDEPALEKLFAELERRAPKQLELLMRLISDHAPEYKTPKKEFLARFNFSEAACEGLAKKGVILITHETIDRISTQGKAEPIPAFSPGQEQAYTGLKSRLDEKEVVLVHGITSSGKTQLYLKLIEECLEKGGQALYLVPEIALTTQLIRRIQGHFGGKAIVSHSRFNENERVEIWNKVSSGEIQVVLGARSALFLPFIKLGLVVVDEEHESSFKQMDPAPRYHARDSAIYLAGLWKCKTVLGSATPSLESYYNAQQGKYGLVTMTERYGKAPLPEIQVVDMAEEVRTKKARSIFSSTLLEQLEEGRKNGEQAILFHNRKGYIPVTMCVVCGWTPKCTQCDISLTYYKHSNSLVCHYCGYHQAPVSKCQACGGNHLEMLGYGTERIEDDLKLLIPHVQAGRFDNTTTRSRQGHQRILSDFESGKTDVLIGTQMLSKGLDFDNVSLVGIVHADQLLNYPDFRAFERSFQLMEQVAGRAGRRDKTGKVIIQTYKKDHRIILNLLEHDYQGFYRAEMEEREKFGYPPFSRLIRITLKHKDFYALEKAAEHMGIQLKSTIGSSVLGPETPLVAKLRNYYLKQFLVKIIPGKQSLSQVKAQIRKSVELMYAQKTFAGTLAVIDVDPS